MQLTHIRLGRIGPVILAEKTEPTLARPEPYFSPCGVRMEKTVDI